MRNINTIVLDIDGTILNSDRKISEKTKNALIKVQEMGIKVVLASGRPTASMMWIAKELQLDKHHGLLVSFNGACVVDVESQKILYSQPIDQAVGKTLLNHLKDFDVRPMVYDGNYMFVNNVYDGQIEIGDVFKNGETTINIIEYESRNGNYLLCEVEDLEEFIDFPLYKVLIAGDKDYLKATYKEIEAPLKDKLNCVFSAPFYFEFTDKNIDKANTLKTVLEPMGYKQENTIAFGDGHNDLSMIKYAGVGVAMANAEQAVLDGADEITLSNDEDGIYHTLSKYFDLN